ncbi:MULTISPECIES: diadenylate cyclase CdaA [Paenibacillus]|uniref:Diadenylate cyclase n=1 Tax=Paenibacillus oleatilyticus TaxID=2594886 RepID=A0ABV4VAF7_9BACL|nr:MULTISPECIES: diadenylate cyclase CdaA [Paenibacillus]MBU7321067.1 diadenylate cyclase CdaA [Paenibacillus oleatilyticus]MCM3272947.1 diadenylate cyclase CdaA [Paenibacillus elgii]NEN83753.1 TIGR00159 family protein [Paenibacillus elgii]GLI04424.1 cyclic di-AMP synthase CdaA [Paenibacillus tyrfis]GMX66333.1 diadenylate cyclase CdaA [Paenibacillus elgii]
MDWITEIDIKDIIDILIVSYVIYKLILVVRGTRAIQLLKGIFVVVVTWALSSWFKLNTLQWMMNQMFTFGLVGVFIIFQPELRRALEQLGRGKLFSRTTVEEDTEVNRRINEVLKAVTYMARRKIGALIVFERDTGLTDYIESGIAIESQISSELLINIFVPNTPLHDGAVILRKHQLMAAGCYLPLSENPFISKELGTRHRAAIGMSEVSDAMCVIVSEETGAVSLAMNGHILRDVKEDALLAKLFEELKPKAKTKEKRSIWKWRRR